MNVLYAGVYNPISFAVNGKKCSDYLLRIKEGLLRRTDECTYELNPTQTGHSRIYIYVVHIKGMVIDSLEFIINPIPDPIARLGPSNHGPISFRTYKGVRAVMEDFDFPVTFEVLGYDFLVERAGNLIASITNVGAIFNEDVKELIDHTKSGDVVKIEKIKARGPDGRTRQLESIKLIVR